jgi:hypothetical protein
MSLPSTTMGHPTVVEENVLLGFAGTVDYLPGAHEGQRLPVRRPLADSRQDVGALGAPAARSPTVRSKKCSATELQPGFLFSHGLSA